MTCIKTLVDELATYDIETIRAHVGNSGHPVNILRRRIDCYWRAKHAANSYGYVGVGAIAFAQHRLMKFEERLRARGVM